MRFTVLPPGSTPRRAPGERRGVLVRNLWDDWFRFETLHYLFVQGDDGQLHNIGGVKFGRFDMTGRTPDLPHEFESLDDSYFSVGQDDSYYEDLDALGERTRMETLRALRDIAFDEELCEVALTQDVTNVSLLRNVTQSSVVGQYRRLAHGGARLTRYKFKYQVPRATPFDELGPELEFEVLPDSQPPTNIHALIGRNGVGKTHLLHHMTRSILDEQETPWDELGAFSLEVDGEGSNNFANVVSVSFSAFDRFEPIGERQGKLNTVQYAYVGLRRVPQSGKDPEKALPPKSPNMLAAEFGTSVKSCIEGARLGRWQQALRVLAGDPIFADAGIVDLAEQADADGSEQIREKARSIFRRLSSGHKIVLLTMTRLVEKVEERSLVVLDEPEAHLHPPLLAAFVRALSDLLINRNGMAIIATHSPVVLQEVPAVCTWKLRRSGEVLASERPEIETFGENVGVLTREVFGLEVTRSGFHKMLSDAVLRGDSYAQIVDRFDQRLGSEAKALIMGLIAARDASGVS